ncbi:WXG100 family type VII secretion target [Actinomadura roseirufa]|uniref:WXG100 family type VII secretion target n=1 Tax=Actinomadura roseirufa TaxID=2094049 RepID=UPI0010411F8F|nr:WXG100 family type VII secretion target [Actinomadura roseirufa]
MTAEYLEVDTEALKRAGEGFHDRAAALDGILTRLDAALAAEGACWGRDATGKKFEEGYKGPCDDVRKMFPQLSKGLDGIKSGVEQMARTYKAAEDASRPK